MNRNSNAKVQFDPAAQFAAALSLWNACERAAVDEQINLSACFGGGDQFMREVIRIGTLFEQWSCRYVDFENIEDVWPYLLEEHFGVECLASVGLQALPEFDEEDCLRVGICLRLPFVWGEDLPVPLCLKADSPLKHSAFSSFRIETMRDRLDDNQPVPFRSGEEPFDESFGPRYFSLFGSEVSGKLEHIADRATFGEVLALAKNLVPEIVFRSLPTQKFRRSSKPKFKREGA